MVAAILAHTNSNVSCAAARGIHAEISRLSAAGVPHGRHGNL
jgi:hypothetical protein